MVQDDVSSILREMAARDAKGTYHDGNSVRDACDFPVRESSSATGRVRRRGCEACQRTVVVVQISPAGPRTWSRYLCTGPQDVSAKQGDPEVLTALLADARHLDPARIRLGCGTEGGEDGDVALAAVGEEVDLGVDVVDTVNNIVGVPCEDFRNREGKSVSAGLEQAGASRREDSPSSSSSANSFSNSDIPASTSTQGATCAKYSAHEVTLGVPTCASVAVEWRCCKGAGGVIRV